MYNNKNNKNNKNNNKNNNKRNIKLYIYTYTRRIRGADTTLDKCWADVVGGGQHRANAMLYVLYTYIAIRDITFLIIISK